MSGKFGGTTITEIRKSWSIIDLLDAIDYLTYTRAVEHAQAQKNKDRR